MQWWVVKTARLTTTVLADNEVVAKGKAIAFWRGLGADVTFEMIVSAEPQQEG